MSTLKRTGAVQFRFSVHYYATNCITTRSWCNTLLDSRTGVSFSTYPVFYLNGKLPYKRWSLFEMHAYIRKFVSRKKYTHICMNVVIRPEQISLEKNSNKKVKGYRWDVKAEKAGGSWRRSLLRKEVEKWRRPPLRLLRRRANVLHPPT